MLSNTCKYGIRAMVYLAVHAQEGKKIGIKKIADDLQIPTPFLGKILQMLTKKGFLSSLKGPHGGFGVGKPPEDISLFDIVELIDGDGIFNDCLVGIRSCEKGGKPTCAIHEDYVPIRNQIKTLFENRTIAYLASIYDRDEHLVGL